ncbi:pentatricopeptide repeat-containing protein At1g01970 [Phragmites australis]|uniref:pentatricopeptide repeat-containing protein At1g01970 n=1 Tax=Phragmites australis TaxID=29695 RepID=UPI002D789E72|nr:pentatricopeptide repeat-containing protein At1g01970 [Phragmites australis]
MVSLAVTALYSLGTQLASAPTSTKTSFQCACVRVPAGHGAELKALAAEAEQTAVSEAPRFRWDAFGSDLSESQKRAIRGLSPKLPNRCKALMTRVVCLSPGDENLGALLAYWVKAMKPKRADWLLVLKELKAMESTLLAELLEYALLEDSFEANVRDYTKLIHIRGKQKLLQKAEDAFHAMKGRGLPCDQVMLTALMDMYSKAGDLTRAKEIFEEIVLLGLPLDKRAYGSMTMAYIRADMLDKAEDLIKEMEDQQTFAGKEVYKALLRAYSYKGDSGGAQRIFDAIQFAGIVPDTKLCALLVNAYCLSSRIDEAVCVIRNMRSAGVKPCDKCIALVLRAYEKVNMLESALAFLTELEENGVTIGQEPSQLLAGWFRRLGVVHDVQQVLKDLSEENSNKKIAVSLEQK